MRLQDLVVGAVAPQQLFGRATHAVDVEQHLLQRGQGRAERTGRADGGGAAAFGVFRITDEQDEARFTEIAVTIQSYT
jgi:hypothetical protein